LVASASNLDAPVQRLSENDWIHSVAWSNSGGLLFPSNRGGSVNLWGADSAGKARPLGESKNCVETTPAPVPNSSQVVYSSNCAGGDDFNLWQIDSTTGARLQLTSGSSYDDSPVVTPDGKWIIYTSWPSNIHTLWKIAVGGGNAAPLGPRAPQQARNPAISPDGKSILCQMRELYDGAWRVAILSLADGSTQQELPDLPPRAGASMRWSPDGKAIDFVDDRGPASNIWRKPLNGEARPLTHFSTDRIYDFAWNKNGTMLAYVKGHAKSDVVFFHRAGVTH
jgi:Tol biopolymer transport system component